MKELRFAIVGAGFWSRYQLAGWREHPSARCVAVFNRTRAKAEALTCEFGVERLPRLMGFTVQGCPYGTGNLKVPEILKLISPHSRCKTAILEQWTPPELRLTDTIAKEASWVKRGLNYLKPLFC